MPAPFSHNQQFCPALYLYPLNDSFIPKHIVLLPQQRVKIGRQTNAKTVPAERNGFFDSKVLSRQHAEVWEEGGKIFIKDVKSSNGTFINGERLSPEGLESEPFELKTDDIVEFGIDIVGEDNKTIVHHKVAARVVCILSEQDAQAAARAEQQQGAGPSNGLTFNGAQVGPGGPQRRPGVQPQGFMGMGGMGASMRPPGKSGLTFDHILSRLQGELQKSRETGAELHSLTSAMGGIHETLGGAVPPNLPSYPQTLPPVMPPQQHQQEPSAAVQSVVIGEIQNQLQETQLSLAGHAEKFHVLDNLTNEHEGFKREILSLKDLMEDLRRVFEISHQHRQEDFSSDDDDTRSIGTIVPHELERVQEEDEEAATHEAEDRRRTRDEFDRPRTPEPTGMGDSDDEDSEMKPVAVKAGRQLIPEDIVERLTTLSNQLESALELSRTLQAQQASAQSTISFLESKVSALESLVQTSHSKFEAQSEAHLATLSQIAEASRIPAAEREKDRESVTQMVNEWKKGVEGKWNSAQEEWSVERERLRRARDEWEMKARTMEDDIAARIDSRLAAFQQQHSIQGLNGSAKPTERHIPGLVTPPSPRSLSSDSMRPRSRKKRSGSGRGRSKSPVRVAPEVPTDTEGEEEQVGRLNGIAKSPRPRRTSPWMSDDSSDSETHPDGTDSSLPASIKREASIQFPITPESSVVCQSHTLESKASKDASELFVARYSTFVGVLVLSVAAAAVVWRVKPE